MKEDYRISNVGGRMPICENNNLQNTDIDRRKHGQQTGFGTLVVHAINNEYQMFKLNSYYNLT